MTQERLAQTVGLETSALRSKLIYRTGAVPDAKMLASVSVALGFDARWLPGLFDGTYSFTDDPQDLPEPETRKVQPKKWQPPATTPETREAARDRELRVAQAKIRILESRVAELAELAGLASRLAELEAVIYAQPGVHRRAG